MHNFYRNKHMFPLSFDHKTKEKGKMNKQKKIWYNQLEKQVYQCYRSEDNFGHSKNTLYLSTLVILDSQSVLRAFKDFDLELKNGDKHEQFLMKILVYLAKRYFLRIQKICVADTNDYYCNSKGTEKYWYYSDIAEKYGITFIKYIITPFKKIEVDQKVTQKFTIKARNYEQIMIVSPNLDFF